MVHSRSKNSAMVAQDDFKIRGIVKPTSILRHTVRQNMTMAIAGNGFRHTVITLFGECIAEVTI